MGQKARAQLTAGEVDALIARLEERLATVAVQTQPEIAAKVVALVNDRNAAVADFAKVVRNDAVLSGRLLKLANSAFFAQRSPVTTVDRACVLLGLERLRSLAMSFYISRAAGDPNDDLSKRIWGQSVFRACLAAELAARSGLARIGEAFVIGLMLDMGVPLMGKLLGPKYADLVRQSPSPHKLFLNESQQLEFTHVDVAWALGRRWRLPDLITRPVERHHTKPGEGVGADDVQRLHRVAYFAGMVVLDTTTNLPAQASPAASTACALLGMDTEELASSITRACGEYRAVVGTFSDVATALNDLDALAAIAHCSLTNGLEQSFEAHAASHPPEKWTFGDGALITLSRTPDGASAAVLLDSTGQPIAVQRLDACKPGDVLTLLGIEPVPGDPVEEFHAAITRFAA